MFIHLRKVFYKSILVSIVVGLFGFSLVLAASGDLDTTFSGDGLIINPIAPSNPGRHDEGFGIAIQPNGKIVVAGHSGDGFALARYNPNGSLDTTFSGNGTLITNFGGSATAYDVVLQSNGKIVAAGETCTISGCDVALARYTPAGALDTTFSGDGKQTTDFGGSDNGSRGGLAIQPDGKIVIAGYARIATGYDFVVYRYLSNGNLDPTFSGDGRARIGFGAGQHDLAYDLAIQSDGKLVVIGNTGNLEDIENFALVRLNTNGSLDTTFSGDGRKTTDFGASEIARSVSIQSNGKIVVAGEKVIVATTQASFALARYNINGSLDTTFNSTGKKVFGFLSGEDAWAEDALVQSDGKIMATGGSEDHSGKTAFALVRLNTDGSFDTSFSGNGKVRISIVSTFSHPPSHFIALQPSDGKYLIGGAISQFAVEPSDFALVRVLP